MSALLIQKIGLLSTQGLNITSAHTAIDNLSVEPPRPCGEVAQEESRVVASAPRSECVNISAVTIGAMEVVTGLSLLAQLYA